MRRALFLAAALFASAALADAKHQNPFLSQAKVFATQGEGDKCLKRLIQAEQKWKFNDKKDRAEIELFGGICGYLVGETQAAEVSFKNAVKIDPKIELPKDFGPGIEQLWAKATGKAVPSAGSAAVAEKEKPGKKEKPVEAAPPPVAKNVPPPPPKAEPLPPPKPRAMTADEKLDQQISEEANAPMPEKKSRSLVLPVIFGIAGVGAGVSGIVLGLQAKSHEAQFKNLDTFYSDAQTAGNAARTEALVTNIMFAAAGVLLVAAIITIIAG